MKESKNPYNGQKLYEFKELTDGELDKKIQLADDVFHSWKKTTFGHRSQLMLKAAQELKTNTDKYAKIMTQEMGKPISQSIAEVEKCAWVCEYYAERPRNNLRMK